MSEPSNRLREALASQMAQVPAGWQPVLRAWQESPEGRGLLAHVAARQAAGATIYPHRVFRALELTPPEAVRVVILGQDPYHGPGQAEGLAFSVPAGQKLPPSLRNIFKEQQRDLGLPMPASGHLGGWAMQGVLLLNSALTVEDGQAASHAKCGWEALTQALVGAVASDLRPKAFLLWGAHAQAQREQIAAASPEHLVLQSNHPSPLSALRPPLPFIGNGHFSAVNRFLSDHGQPPVDWSAPGVVGGPKR